MIDLTCLKSAKGLKFCHLNVRSLLNKVDQFKLQFGDSEIEVITVSESWLTEEIDSNILTMKNYHLYRVDRTYLNEANIAIKKGGGLLMFVRKDLNFSKGKGIDTVISESDIEVQRLELVSKVQKDILIYNVYRPPGGSVTRCTDVLSELLGKENRLHLKEILVLGDFNINYTSKNNPDTKKLTAWQNKHGLVQKIKGKTRCTKNSSSTIDLMFTNMDHVSESGVVDLHVSDHKPVYLIKEKIKDCRKTTNFRGRSYISYDKNLLSDSLTNSIKSDFRNEKDPNKCWDLMESFLCNFLDKNCPLKTFRTKDCTPAWVTNDLITLAKDRDRMWQQAILSNSEEDWILARRLRNWSNNAVKAAKANYVKNELNINSNDSKKFWRNIKNVLPEKSSGSINIMNKLTGEELPKSMQPQVINDFFANIGNRLDAKFGPVVQPNINVIPNDDELVLEDISQPEVVKLVNTISMYKSSGLENINSRVIKDFMLLAVREVTHLYNCIISTGIFPDKWKIASVTPIPKISNATDPSDLRPISLLPIPGKLLEKFITEKMTKYLERKSYFSKLQFGFRNGKSTSGAFTDLLDNMVEGLNNSEFGIAAYLDFQKAFDTINHSFLLTKLREAGLGAKLMHLLKNYLTNRNQKTKLNGITSTLEEINVGLPQGSTVGPIMFIIYINDLPDVLLNSQAVMYADDTVLFCRNASSKVLRKMLQSDLDLVQQWCTNNRLTLNVKKTKIMSFMSKNKRKSCRPFKLYMKCTLVEEVETYKYLGTTVDNKLSGECQYGQLTKSLGYKLRTFGKIRTFLTTTAAAIVYKSTILPIIDYNDYYQLLWNVGKVHKLQKYQNWGLRIIYADKQPKLSEDEMHVEARVSTLKVRRIVHLLDLMYDRAKSDHRLDKRDLPTRQFDKIKFKVLAPSVKVAFKCPHYYGAQLWDLLPLETQSFCATDCYFDPLI